MSDNDDISIIFFYDYESPKVSIDPRFVRNMDFSSFHPYLHQHEAKACRTNDNKGNGEKHKKNNILYFIWKTIGWSKFTTPGTIVGNP